MTNTKPSSNLYTMLISLSLLLTLITVILSAYIRLSVNGIGCNNWPDCFAYVGSANQYDAATSFTDAAPSKPHGFARASHRVVASVLGLFVVLIFAIALRNRRQGFKIGMPLAVLALTLFLSILGYSTPSPWIPAITLGNLLGGMLMLSLLWWMSQESVNSTVTPAAKSLYLKPWALLGWVLIILQISLGAWTSANYAGPACSGLGACQDSWLPIASLTESLSLMRVLQVDSMGKIIMDNTMPSIHMLHRWGALFTFIYLMWLALKIRFATDTSLHATASGILIFLILQVILGLTAVLSELPLLIVTAHNAVAALLLLSITNLNQVLFKRV